MTIIIITNTAILAQYDYSVRVDPNLDSVRNSIQQETEIAFTTIFIIEFAMKSIAYGFIIGKGSYLRDSWNILDFIVVISA
jgi:voltage-dependent calcium channel L type alpha-1D